MNELYEEVLAACRGVIESDAALNDKLQKICEILESNIKCYDWVGFYLLHPEKERWLRLGPFVGDPTEHVNIQFGEGICGQSAETKQIFVVNDVSEVTNYLSCSPRVQSEIVVPIMKDGEFVGELDIDSHECSPFHPDDSELLENICVLLAPLMEVHDYG